MLKGLELGTCLCLYSHMSFIIGIKMSDFIMTLFLNQSLSVCMISYVIKTTLPLNCLYMVLCSLFSTVLLFRFFFIMIFYSCVPATLSIRMLSIHILDILMIMKLRDQYQ